MLVKHQLASGQFGKVFKGILRPENPEDEEDWIEVAIKAPKVSILNSQSLCFPIFGLLWT